MERTLLVSGLRADFTVLGLNIAQKSLRVVSNYAAPFNASWVEPLPSTDEVDRFMGLSESEDDEQGLLYTFEIDHKAKNLDITSQQLTLGAPAHFITLQDQSALALSTYLGGSIAFYPISTNENNGLRLQDVPREELFPEFAYKSVQHGPNAGRQRQCHLHHVLEDKKGLIYAADLGSDRLWIFSRADEKATLVGWLQCPPGSGPRHSVLNHEGDILYVIGELSHTVVAFDLAQSPAEDIKPLEGFEPNVIPPSVHPDHQSTMDSSEICTHPFIRNVLYVSNRWERHIAKREPELHGIRPWAPTGDAITIIVLTEDGRAVECIKHIRTHLDTIRGMRISDDGKYIAAVGQGGGGIEVYEIGGKAGDEWKFVASLRDGLESGIKHVVWV